MSRAKVGGNARFLQRQVHILCRAQQRGEKTLGLIRKFPVPCHSPLLYLLSFCVWTPEFRIRFIALSVACAHSLVTDAFYVGDEFNGRIKHPQPQVLNADEFAVCQMERGSDKWGRLFSNSHGALVYFACVRGEMCTAMRVSTVRAAIHTYRMDWIALINIFLVKI